ncbi:hypothetical protein ZHAS_00018873 [Anopheles sinensis]|uniref:Uncharacterized protein n=1 Tax=Anopheles sinensis TaxID=74873 RepID=A0A084WKS5_ANOSI|nr:hypothetical protein ZHAS_00018873 [Anopheles sinensis]
MENRLNDKQQCLDYLGDNGELSPAQICKKSSQSIETKLKTLRLRHCCERTVGSALHNAAYAEVLSGGAGCTDRLTELLETDALAARITCEFTEVLIRYDCGQKYSIIHRCEDCKVHTRGNWGRFVWGGGEKDNRSSNPDSRSRRNGSTRSISAEAISVCGNKDNPWGGLMLGAREGEPNVRVNVCARWLDPSG